MRYGYPDAMLTARDRPADTLTEPNTGQRLWMRPFWEDQATPPAEIVREGDAPCPACGGDGSTSEPIPDRRRSAWSRRTLPPECDDETVTCGTCRGAGTIEDALYGHDDVLLWPTSLTDYEDGHD